MSQSQLNEDEKRQLLVFLGKHRNIFANDISEIGCTDKYFHRIHTGDAQPVRSFPWKPSPATAAEMDRQVVEMERYDIIEPSNSAWSPPVCLCKKKNGKYRFTVDLRNLNKITDDILFKIQ